MSDQAKKQTLTYADAGVSIDAGNAFVGRIKDAVASTTRPEVIGGLGGFGALFKANFAGMEEPVLVSSTDGVGTKLLLLQQHQRPHVAGIDAVAMCVNDMAAQAAEPLFFLDYLATGKLDDATLASVVEGIAEACRICECSLIGGETAEMPGMYAPGHYDIGGFSVGVVDRPKVIDGSTIAAGDVMLGIASSGPHSNGFSLIRKLIEVGAADITNDTLSDGTPAIDTVLAPTRLYVPAVKAMIKAAVEVHGYSHITGGGMFDNIERILPEGLAATVDISSWPVPPVFEYLLSFADVERNERYRTFNMGIGFVAILPGAEAEKAEAVLRETGETVYRIGTIHPLDGEVVTLVG
ncbi:MAG: phosphoribosylformylglycinamidine cyclo-ligase [Zetaproteobacteria bacterium CG_4_9_14_3_um_filter_49_83]|nr:MAG: phosphoribosylformylglycinamidine cyclo-ligase [Zetaproteobacteria bacterium CG1_02_49_23]PIQ29910.1 MAG: phosphoribosylformylglycinamidine cyclo-ligase [Zetaproteobacteria bacterium CG17_big_fil_post_rev_8_21_14_2_50_50_13]PIV31039.1 MAG: phosphoribosylformylglycinamidine cyclo-ligase [Zetaproteobacteria bacterium CG02_land_8_20_14_3_00_50_9]PIY55222.1 MAG: phosphoribosylformylglycinamidine cyclo-ligase [Zetaproteobacteria bacterium CG_4_10_14_0_8_um_filter_49_80]PJA36214.1 MAG: phosph